MEAALSPRSSEIVTEAVQEALEGIVQDLAHTAVFDEVQDAVVVVCETE